MPSGDSAKERVNAGQRQRHAARVASGCCSRCGKGPPEPGLKLCRSCGEKRRTADKARRARPQEGKLYGGRDPLKCRRSDRAGDGAAAGRRRVSGTCRMRPQPTEDAGRSVCEPTRGDARARPRRNYSARAAGVCVRCAEPAIGGTSRCARHATLEAERVSPERRNATSRKRYVRRRAKRICVDCGIGTAGSARCPACASRSNTRAPAWHAAQPGPPFYTVIELETGIDHGTYDTEAEAAACLVFAGLRIDQVEILSNVPLLAPSLTGMP